jgi:hypothetical protein
MILRKPGRAALAAIAILVAAASASFAESYRALVLWASHHGLHGLWAAIFPAQIDTFVLVGELALFVALAVGLGVLKRVAVRHHGSGPSTAPPVPPATEPVPPTPSSEDPALAAYRASVASGSPLSARQLAAQHDIGRRQAGRVVAQVSHEANGHSNLTEQDQETR